jgi:hypothetical protein
LFTETLIESACPPCPEPFPRKISKFKKLGVPYCLPWARGRVSETQEEKKEKKKESEDKTIIYK